MAETSDNATAPMYLDEHSTYLRQDLTPAIARLVTSTEFNEHRTRIQSFMEKSRRLRKRPLELLHLQADMAGALLSLQQSRKELKRHAEKEPKDESSSGTELRARLAIAKRLILLIRQIADGIAWRSLGYDRASILQLSLKPHSGHIELNAATDEFILAEEFVTQTGATVIVNDVTNCLRYGDFTSIQGNQIIVHEVKSGAGSAKSGRASRQRKKLEQKLSFIRHGQTRTEDGLHKIVRFNSKPKSHASRLKDLCAAARRDGASYERVSDVLGVEVFDIQQISEHQEGKAYPTHNPFRQSRDSRAFHSLELFAEFSHNIAPYSVFPLPVQDCTDIMIGTLWVVSYFNLGNLARCLRRRDLVVRVPTAKELSQTGPLLPGQVAQHELDNPILVTRGPGSPVLGLSFSSLGRIIYEFLDEDSFADTVEENLDNSGHEEPALLFSSFLAEHELWD